MSFSKTIKEIVSHEEYGYYGVRAVMENPITGETIIYEIGDYAHNSYDWIDGNNTDTELNGTCALGINEDSDLKEKMQELEAYCWGAKQIVLLGSNNIEYGNDNGEIIMQDAVVLATMEI